MNYSMFNIVLLGISFMLVFTAFQTCGMVQEIVLESAQQNTTVSFKGAGLNSLAIIYAVFSLSNWVSPVIVAFCGPRLSLILSAVVYNLFVLSFLNPILWVLYLGSAMLGFAAAVIWTAQGNFLTLNSNHDTIGRNSGIFWGLFQSSLLWGNLYQYLSFKDVDRITYTERWQLFLVLSITCAVGIISMLAFRKPTVHVQIQVDMGDVPENESCSEALGAFKGSIKLIQTKVMMLILITCAYTGLELTFFSGVYGTMLGHNEHFGNQAKSMIGLSGILIGAGEIVGGLAFSIFGHKTNVHGRDPIIFFGYVLHMLAFYLCFINLPMDASLPSNTNGPTYLYHSSIPVALVCAFLLGLGDACFNVQIVSILGDYFSNNSAPAFGLYKFSQSLTSAAAFFYSSHFHLQWQLLILVVTGTIGALSFIWAEFEAVRSRGGPNNGINTNAYLPVETDDEHERLLYN